MKIHLSVPQRMISAELFSDLGNQFIHLTLMATLFFGQSDSLTNLIFLCLIQQMPAILLGPPTGIWIERIGPRYGLVGANLIKYVCIAGLLLTESPLPVWGLYLLFMVASLMFYISRLAITPCLIAKERLIDYNSINERVALAAGIAGLWLIGLLIRHAGGRAALALGIGMFLCSGLLVRGLPHIAGARSSTGTIPQIAGWKRLPRIYIAPLCDRRVKIWFALLGVVIVSGGILNLGGPLFNKSFFTGDIAAWGGVMSGYQAGACLAALFLPALARRFADHTLVILSFVTLGLGFGLLALFQGWPLFIIVMMGFGFGFTLVSLFLESRIQRDCAKNRLGRMMAALSAFRGTSLLTGILAGAFIANLGGVRLLMVLGALTLATGVLRANR